MKLLLPLILTTSSLFSQSPVYKFSSQNYTVRFFRNNPTSPETIYQLRQRGQTSWSFFSLFSTPPPGYLMTFEQTSRIPCLEYQVTVYVKSGQKIPTVVFKKTPMMSKVINTTSYPTTLFVLCIGRLNNEFLLQR